MKRITWISSVLCMILLLSACGSRVEEIGEADEQIQLSNVRFSTMELTAEERAMMDEVETVLRGMELDCSSDYGALKAVNTASQSLDLRLFMNCYDLEGTITSANRNDLQDWMPGERLDLKIWVRTADLLRAEKIEIMAMYPYGTSYYFTDPVRLNPEEDNVTMPIAVAIQDGLPLTVQINSWKGNSEYELTDFSFQAYPYGDDKYDFVFYFTKNSGEPIGYETMDYRFRRADGVIAETRVLSFSYLSAGDRVRVTQDYVELKPGEYTIEFMSG